MTAPHRSRAGGPFPAIAADRQRGHRGGPWRQAREDAGMAVDDDAGPQVGQADLAADLGVDGQVSLGHIEFVGERETWPAAARSLPGF